MTLKCVNTDNSHLVILPLAPLLFALYLHLIALSTLPPPSPMPAKMNSSTDTASRHSKYYITGADLVIRVRGFPIETVSLSNTES